MPVLLRAMRVLSLVLLAVLGTSALMYAAPGYFTDAGEMDAAHASASRTSLQQMKAEQGSVAALVTSEIKAWSRGDLGRSRQFEVPVSTLLKERAWRSARLLALGVLAGWSLAMAVALPLSLRNSRFLRLGVTGLTSLLLALPVGVLATLCLLRNMGGPVLVLAIVITARDIKILHSVLRTALQAPHVLHAQASGIGSARVFSVHVFPNIRTELIALVVMSFTLALSALVPVEVLFDLPGLGQLAWSAAMNRDLPVLVAVTGIMSACVGIAAALAKRDGTLENAPCA